MNKRPLSTFSSFSVSNNGEKRLRTSPSGLSYGGFFVSPQHPPAMVKSSLATGESGEDDPMTRLTLGLPGYSLNCGNFSVSSQHPPSSIRSSSTAGKSMEDDQMTRLTLALPRSSAFVPQNIFGATSKGMEDDTMTRLGLALPGYGSHEVSSKKNMAAEMMIETTTTTPISWPPESEEEKEMIRNIARRFIAHIRAECRRRNIKTEE